MYQPYKWIDPSLLDRIRNLGGNNPQSLGLYKPSTAVSYMSGVNRNKDIGRDLNESRRQVLSRVLGLKFPEVKPTDRNRMGSRKTGPFAGYY